MSPPSAAALSCLLVLSPALGCSQEVTPPAPEPASEHALHQTPSRAQVLTAMQAVRESVRACAERHGTIGVVTAKVFFEGQTGTVRSVELEGTLNDWARACMEDAVKSAQLPPFSRDTFSVTFPYGEKDPVEADGLAPPTDGPTRGEQARACMMRGDNRCVVRLLEGQANSQSDLALLIETYRMLQNRSAMERHMRTFVERWPGSPKAESYARQLDEATAG